MTSVERILSKEKREQLIKEVEELSGESVHKCYQCGKCTAGCPFTSDMDLKPNQVIRLVQLGMREVLEKDSIWLCASCLVCGARCPKGVDLSRIMEALRLMVFSEKAHRLSPKDIDPEELKELPNIALVCAFRKQTG